MEIREKLIKQLKYSHFATDIPVRLSDDKGEVLCTYGETYAYCRLIREACGSQSFCEECHGEGEKRAAWLKDGYIYDCPCGMAHFSVPMILNGRAAYYILAGPVALEYPDILLVDQIIDGYNCSLNYRNKLYSAMGGVPIVEPVRLQYLNELLNVLVKNLAAAAANDRNDREDQKFAWEGDQKFMPVMKNALRYIENHYREPIRLGQVAKYIGLNSSYFSTLFKQEMGVNFSQYVTEKRIGEACRLLKNTNMSLVEIASELGFDNQSYFSRIFKKTKGIAPKMYRQKRE